MQFKSVTFSFWIFLLLPECEYQIVKTHRALVIAWHVLWMVRLASQSFYIQGMASGIPWIRSCVWPKVSFTLYRRGGLCPGINWVTIFRFSQYTERQMILKMARWQRRQRRWYEICADVNLCGLAMDKQSESCSKITCVKVWISICPCVGPTARNDIWTMKLGTVVSPQVVIRALQCFAGSCSYWCRVGERA